jgi:hypothetical protein
MEKLHNWKLYYFFAAQIIMIRVNKWRKRWAVHLACVK